MPLRFVAALAAGLLLAAPAAAQVKIQPPPKTTPTPDVLKTEVRVKAEEVADLPLLEVLQLVAKRHDGLTFVINEEEFIQKNVASIKEKRSPAKFETKGLTLHQFLNTWLAGIDAAYVAQADYVEVVPLAQPAAPPKPKPATAEAVLKALYEPDVESEGDLGAVPLAELLGSLAKRRDLNIVIREAAFRAEGVNDIKERKPVFAATPLKGITLHQFLSLVLEGVNATYLVRNGYIEVVPVGYAARVTKSELTAGGDGQAALAEPLVSVVVKEKPLNEVLAELAERYDLNVTIAPQSGDARTGFVTARLLNVPADRAVEQLAMLADLRVVRKGNTYLVTGRDHANELFNEKLDRERQRIEVEKLRTAPPPKPEPEPKPEPKP